MHAAFWIALYLCAGFIAAAVWRALHERHGARPPFPRPPVPRPAEAASRDRVGFSSAEDEHIKMMRLLKSDRLTR